ncbi:ABC transporter substrate-binding protein [Cellvibrio sp. pealriver]|uniref:substrate-binding periplasmic protein n=1 Tax=Cellvibrio sp. pealriver TaxID=1622269 RepID=UPI00069D7F9D|nr:transporter substrate-binding domain-containing protein [Cellvibrio sp. pealriver]
MKPWLVRICGLILLLPLLLSAEELSELRIAKPRAMDDPAYLYFSGLLQKALQKTANGRAVPPLVTTIAMAEDRMVRELRAGRIDILWLGGSKERARNLLVVPIPLERGLVGYRQFIIRKSRVAEFDAINTLADLRKFKACQGAQWGDTEILRTAKLPLVTSVNYESLFKLLVAGRCDYYPRGFHQGKIELANRTDTYPELMVYEPLMLYYPFAAYFYVHPRNKQLAQWLQDGLEKMIDDGELLAYMQQHEHTRRAFPLQATVVKRLLVVPNHYLPDFADEKNARYWFQPGDFSLAGD